MLRAAKKCHCYGCSLDLKFLLYRAFVVGFVNDLGCSIVPVQFWRSCNCQPDGALFCITVENFADHIMKEYMID